MARRTDGYYLNMVVKDQPEIWYDGKQKELTFDKIIPNEKTNNPYDTTYVLGRKHYTKDCYEDKFGRRDIYVNYKGDEFVASKYYENKLVPSEFGYGTEDEDHDCFHLKSFESFGSWINGEYEMLDHMYQSYTAEGYIDPSNGYVGLFEFFDFVKENYQSYQNDGKWGLDFCNRIN